MVYTKEEVLQTSKEYFNGDELAADVFTSKYALRNSKGEFLEKSPEDSFIRLAKEFARIEKKYPNPLSEEEIKSYFDNFKYIIPQGSPFSAVGNNEQIQSLSNCFTLESPHDSYGGILKTDEELVQIAKRRGGIGFDISNIRPKGVATSNAAKTTDGIAVFMERYSNSCREVAQCIAENERVLTKRGLIPIQNIIPNEDFAWTKNGWVRIINLFKKGKQIVYETTTLSGLSIKTTENHLFQSFNNEGSLLELRLKDLEKNDNIVICKGDGIEINNLINLNKNGYKNINNKPDNCVLPEVLDEKLAYILGYSYGDGYSDQDRNLELACSNDYPEIKERLISYITDVYQYNPHVSIGDGALERIRVNNKAIIQHLKFNELLKQKAGFLQFPSKIFQSKQSVQMAFLSGYFDADGYASGRKKGYCFSSVDDFFLKEVQKLLNINGIFSKIHKENRNDIGRKNLYSLVVVGKTSQDKFVHLMSLSHKINELQFVSKRDCWLTPFKAKSFNIKYSNFKYCPDNTQFLSLSTVSKLRNDGEDVVTNLVQDSIKSIEEYDEVETYDIELESEHLFWCEGFYVHNSGRRGALMLTISVRHPEIETFINIKRDLTKVTGANISIRITDDFMEAVKYDSNFQLKWPVDSENPLITKTVKARDIWNQIIDSAWTSAEPGVLFWDTALRNGPADIYEEFRSVATNPCLTKDTWILTDNGPEKIENLIGKKFNAVIDGEIYPSSEEGFFSNGKKTVFRIKTKNGQTIKATKNHKFLTSTGWKQVSEFTKNEKIIIDNKSYNWKNDTDFSKGWLIGSVFGDGNITSILANLDYWGETKFFMKELATSFLKENFVTRSDIGSGEELTGDKVRIGSSALKQLFLQLDLYDQIKKQKKISDKLEKTSSSFLKGFLCGWFDADGSPQGNHKKGVSIRLSSVDKEALYFAQRTLLRFGIYSKVHECRIKEGYRLLPDGNGGYKEYFCQESNELIISNNSVSLFQEYIGFKDPNKKERLENYISSYKRNRNKDKNYFIVESIEEQILQEEVYDCTIPEKHAFVANGFISHNCSEIFLSPYDSCRLMLLNLFNFVENPFTEDANFNYTKFSFLVEISQRLMDDLVDLELEAIDRILEKIHSDPEPFDVKLTEINLWSKIKNACINGRRTGLGVTAIGDTLAALGIQYGSEESVKTVEKIYKTLGQFAHKESIQLAKERGAFPSFDYELEKDHEYLNRLIPESSKQDWKTYGRRNISLTTTAPVGSISILTQTTSGIEPAFMLSYKRRKKISSDKDKVDFIDALGDKWTEYEVFHPKYAIWQQLNPDKKFEDSPYYKATAMDVDWLQSVKIQSVAQKWIDHAISKCVQEGTLIATNKGIFPIEKLSDFEYQEEDTFSEPNDDYYVLDENGNQKKILKHYYGGKKDCYRIKFNNGFSLTASENHMLKSSDGWKKIKDIKVGESIQYRMNSIKDIDKNQLVLLEKINFKNNIKREFPEYCDENFAKFLGMWLADGYVTNHSIGIVEKDDKVCSEIQRLILSIFNIKSTISIDKRNGVRTHTVNSTAIASYFKNNFGQNCATKHVPDFILKSSFDIQKSFIEGLSLDGYLASDGSLVIYDGYSENIANSVSYILSKNGIKYLLTQKKVKNGKLNNISYGVRCYLNSKIFEPIEDHKKEYKLDSGLKDINIFLDKKIEVFYNENYDKSTKNSEIKQRIKRSLKSSRFIRKSLLQSADLLNFVDENLLSIKVVSIDFVGEKEVYDIEVEDSHSYLINGIVSHNTCNIPNSATKELVSEIYMKAWESGCKGFTVYRDGCRTGVLVNTSTPKESDVKFKPNNAIKRPTLLECDINHVSVKGEKWVILIGKMDDNPYEVFGGKADKIQFPSKYKTGIIEKDKGKSKYNLIIEDDNELFIVKDIISVFDNAEYALHTRLLSLSLRHGAPVKYIVDQLQKDTESNLFDFSKVIARVLKKYIVDGESSIKCANCNSKLVFQEGCLSCKTCGISKC